jgi:hypothetical protein
MINFKEQLEQMVEPLARQFAAEKMALVKDKHGENLPAELWKQAVPQARKFLNLE